MQQPPNTHLAQLNIGRIRYEIDDPRMADFTNNLALVNGLAERTPGFVWRFIDDSGNSTSTRPYADPRIAINMSVWRAASRRSSASSIRPSISVSIAAAPNGSSISRSAYFVMWWVPAGHRPSVEEAVARLEHLKQHGPSDHAFDWADRIGATVENGALRAGESAA